MQIPSCACGYGTLCLWFWAWQSGVNGWMRCHGRSEMAWAVLRYQAMAKWLFFGTALLYILLHTTVLASW